MTYYRPNTTLFGDHSSLNGTVTLTLDGIDYGMSLLVGDPSRGQYYIDLPIDGILNAPRGCLAYFFTVVDQEGTWYLPETGYYATWNDGTYGNPNGCFANWVPSAAAPNDTDRPPPFPPIPCPRPSFWLELTEDQSHLWQSATFSASGLEALIVEASSAAGPGTSLRLSTFDLVQYTDITKLPANAGVQLPVPGNDAEPPASWGGVAASFNGKYLLAGQYPGPLYTSNK